MNYHFWALSWTEVVAIYCLVHLNWILWKLYIGGSFLLRNDYFGTDYQVTVLYQMSDSACQSPHWLSVEGTAFLSVCFTLGPRCLGGLASLLSLGGEFILLPQSVRPVCFPLAAKSLHPQPSQSWHPSIDTQQNKTVTQTSGPGSCTAALCTWSRGILGILGLLHLNSVLFVNDHTIKKSTSNLLPNL